MVSLGQAPPPLTPSLSPPCTLLRRPAAAPGISVQPPASTMSHSYLLCQPMTHPGRHPPPLSPGTPSPHSLSFFPSPASPFLSSPALSGLFHIHSHTIRATKAAGRPSPASSSSLLTEKRYHAPSLSAHWPVSSVNQPASCGAA